MQLQDFFINKPLPELLKLFHEVEQFYVTGDVIYCPTLRSTVQEIIPRPNEEHYRLVATEVYRQLAIITAKNAANRSR